MLKQEVSHVQRVKFEEKELTKVGENGTAPIFDTPITPAENFLAVFAGKNPLWMPMTTDTRNFTPRIDIDNVARGFVFDGEEKIAPENFGGPDMFGTEWVFVPVAGGSMVKPGSPRMEDANDWKDIITMPDPSVWDWEKSAKANEEYLSGGLLNSMTFLNGFMYERLISFMDFEGAAISIIDEEQMDAVKELCNTMLDKVYIPYLEHVKKYVPQVQMISLHDDWGSQRAPFFSIATAREMFVPIMKRLAEKCKELGFVFQLHSCGKNELVFPAYMEGGVQMWNGMYMNDKKALFEQYGQNFVFGVDPPDVAKDMEASHEALEAAAKEFCEFFIRDGKCHAVANTMRVNPYFVECVYKISRQMLNS